MSHLVVRTDGRTMDVEDGDARVALVSGVPFSLRLFAELLLRVQLLNENPFVATLDDALLAFQDSARAQAPPRSGRGFLALMPVRPRGEHRA